MATKKTATKKPETKTVSAKKEAAPKKTAAKKAAPKKTAAGKASKANYTPEQVYSMIEQAAYFAAHNDGFKQDPATYWMQAEAEINAMVKG